MERACENCGSPDTDLVYVRRIYTVPEAWDNPISVTGRNDRDDELEQWCFSCRSLYPHELTEAE